MTFWDSSAIVTVLVDQPGSVALREASTHDRCVWWGARTECTSALCRLAREGVLTQDLLDDLTADLARWLGGSVEVQPTEVVRLRAERLLRVHPLRAADAMQLAAALVCCEEAPAGVTFACLDDRLRAAARAEGFRVVPATR